MNPSTGDDPEAHTFPQVEAYIAPASESVFVVNSWLSENGITGTSISSTGGWLMIQVPVNQANDLLGAQFSVFTHPDTKRQAIRTLAYSIPSELVGHLDLVHPTITYVVVPEKSSRR